MNLKHSFYLVIFLLILSGCGGDEASTRQVSSFSFQDHQGQAFGSEDLDGDVWIASFVFANCETVCPPMMMEMAELQDRLEEEEIEAELVTFTVDPEVDSPAELKEYLYQFTEDESNWHMLTGYSQEEIEAFARDAFQTIVQKPDSTDQVIHGTNFYLVNGDGYIVNEFNYIDTSYLDELVEEIKDI